MNYHAPAIEKIVTADDFQQEIMLALAIDSGVTG